MSSSARRAAAAAGLLGFTGVALGAFGAHALKDQLMANGATAIWQTAVFYHLLHAVAVLALGGWLEAFPGARWIVRCWIAGVILFSGSLYALALGGPKALGPVTPLGGLLAADRLVAPRLERRPAAQVMKIPQPLHAALSALRSAGGRPRLVGGCVRDWLLGLEPKDFDIEVYGLDFEAIGRALAAFGPTDLIGRSFGVLKVRLAGVEYDFSLPRRESKTGAGHRGFAVAPDPALTEAEAAARRDFTINAMAYDPFEDRILDFHGGAADLKNRILRHTSPAFTEDPLRVLRAFQLAARFELKLAPATAALGRAIQASYSELPVERVWGEWDKWATKAVKPSLGLIALKETGWLAHFQEIAALDGVPQEPEWHPEGDVFVHTNHCLDALVGLASWREGSAQTRRVLTLSVLAHDFGKATTTKQAERRGKLRWISPEHEAAGGPLVESFLLRIGAPPELIDHVRPLVTNHLLHHDGPAKFRDTAVRRLARKLTPATLDELIAVMLSDHLGRPPLIPRETVERIEHLRTAAQRLALEHAAPKPIVLGRHLIALGLTPGPSFGPALDAAFESQLDGAFVDEAGGLEWMKNYLRAHPSALASPRNLPL